MEKPLLKKNFSINVNVMNFLVSLIKKMIFYQYILNQDLNKRKTPYSRQIWYLQLEVLACITKIKESYHGSCFLFSMFQLILKTSMHTFIPSYLSKNLYQLKQKEKRKCIGRSTYPIFQVRDDQSQITQTSSASKKKRQTHPSTQHKSLLKQKSCSFNEAQLQHILLTQHQNPKRQVPE